MDGEFFLGMALIVIAVIGTLILASLICEYGDPF